jgi:energy-coupling factor transporter ATP-binding protein EcfA2
MLNLQEEGRPLAKVINGPYNGLVVSVVEDPKPDIKTYTHLKLPKRNPTDDITNETDEDKYKGVFCQIPNTKKEREILYICGPSGSGKSHYTKSYALQFKKALPTYPIFVFSNLKSDETLDKVPGIKRIAIDERLISEPLQVADFQNSLVIFDDIDVISPKKIGKTKTSLRDAVYQILDEILETGRHHNVYCVVTNHAATDGHRTRSVLSECHSITYFPHSGSKVQIERLLTAYAGLGKEDIERFKKSGSRWATIFKNYPQIAMTERNIYLLSDTN